MFWGLSMKPGKQYTQTVQEAFHISQATLDVNDTDGAPVQVILLTNGDEFILATLSKTANIFQVPLDLNFEQGEQISFKTTGKGHVYLSGFHNEDDDLASKLLGEEGDSEEEDEDISLDESLLQQGKRKQDSNNASATKKLKLEEDDDEEDDDDDDDDDELEESLGLNEDQDDDDDDDNEEEEEEEDDDDDDDDEEDEDDSGNEISSSVSNKNMVNGLGTPAQKVKLIKSNTIESGNSSKKGAKTPSKETPKQLKQELSSGNKNKKTPQKPENGTPKTPKNSNQKMVLEGNVIAEETKVGDGPIAKEGNMVAVYYIGRLKSNNKQFDATTSGRGFKFRLGRGEVIRGWDIGVTGMKVGGKRKLTIPAALAYGAKGAPPTIPPNSTLVFDVELRTIS